MDRNDLLFMFLGIFVLILYIVYLIEGSNIFGILLSVGVLGVLFFFTFILPKYKK